MKDNAKEIFPVVDEAGLTIGRATRGECHDGSHLLHPVVHLHVFNSKGELYTQRRPLWKDIQPGRWDTAVGGHVDYGESVAEALVREAREELGIEGFEAEHLMSYRFDSERESEYVNVFRTVWNSEIRPSAELDGGCFRSLDEIRSLIGHGVFTPNFEQEFLRLGF
ncbi:MAG: NUDIX domain-containing protein [Muribaculaceae bacterium]|nr:NUDIX domain-containing protein [Muribaculaceae bacterium]